MEDLIIDLGSEIFLNKNLSDLYKNKVTNNELNSLFAHPYNYLNLNTIDEVFDAFEIGGAEKKSTNDYLKIVPTFINIVKGRIIYQGKTKLGLEKITPEKKTPVVLGTILELSKVRKVLEKETLTKKDIMTYINNYDVLPLLFNTPSNKNKDIVFKNKKKTFFNRDSKLCLVTFELTGITSYYAEVPAKEVKVNFENIKDIIKDKNFIVAHYIYDNFFFLVPTHNVKISNCYLINIEPEQNIFDIKETKDFKYEPNNRKINLSEIDSILSKARTYLTVFD